MDQIITCKRIGDGSEENPFRPETNANSWQIVAERENEFDIQILTQIGLNKNAKQI